MDSGISVTKWICTRCGSRWASEKDCPICLAPVRLISAEATASVTKWICSRCGSRWASDKDCPICLAPVRLMSALVSDDPMVGKIIGGRYRVMACIGKGSVGKIFRAFDQTTERQVALKLLRKHLICDDELRARFEQEAMALQALKHNNLIAVREFNFSFAEPYFTMEYIDGVTLAELIGELTYIPVERFLRIFLQVTDALSHAHQHGILHRDIKPANIMLIDLPRHKDVVKIVDFGLAKILTDDPSIKRNMETTGSRLVLGTPLYMSPEQARGAPVDLRSEIYALGCVMYEALCGMPPIKGTGVMEILRAQIETHPVPPDELRPCTQVPPALIALVMRALSKDPAQRHQSMSELKEDLLAVKAGVDSAKSSAQFTTAQVDNNHSARQGKEVRSLWSLWQRLLRKRT